MSRCLPSWFVSVIPSPSTVLICTDTHLFSDNDRRRLFQSIKTIRSNLHGSVSWTSLVYTQLEWCIERTTDSDPINQA
ncbi:MAG: hypothetical protein J3Q66DRAFT_146933 [Benniella sp.]|nr:MAG: hypothetical protein J3Q66DRAFT_146933 [Benniella sp.]